MSPYMIRTFDVYRCTFLDTSSAGIFLNYIFCREFRDACFVRFDLSVIECDSLFSRNLCFGPELI